MSTERIKTIDGKQLLNLEFEPIRFIVNGLIPQGFHILAGAPKTGKSWLLLLLCLKVMNLLAKSVLVGRSTKDGQIVAVTFTLLKSF